MKDTQILSYSTNGVGDLSKYSDRMFTIAKLIKIGPHVFGVKHSTYKLYKSKTTFLCHLGSERIVEQNLLLLFALRQRTADRNRS